MSSGDKPIWSNWQHKLPEGLLENARLLRKNNTPTEQLLWTFLRRKQFLGLKFRRQHPLTPGFILDFYCHEIKLGIEVDGGIHNNPDQNKYDKQRTEFIEELGIKVLRFTNEEIENDIERVLAKIGEFKILK